MKKSQGRKVKKTVAKKAVSKLKKLAKNVKRKVSKAKGKKAQGFLKNAKKKVNALKKKSSRTLSRATKSIYATEQDIVKYVKENPVKSLSTVALVGLVAGFVSRLKK